MDYHDTRFVGENTIDGFYGHNRARLAREQEAHVYDFDELLELLGGPRNLPLAPEQPTLDQPPQE